MTCEEKYCTREIKMEQPEPCSEGGLIAGCSETMGGLGYCGCFGKLAAIFVTEMLARRF